MTLTELDDDAEGSDIEIVDEMSKLTADEEKE